MSDLERPWERQERPIEVINRGSAVEVPDLLVDVGAARALVIEQNIAVPHLEATLRTIEEEQQIMLRNQSEQQISDIVLARGDGMAQQVMTLARGEERSIPLDAGLAPLETLPLTSGAKINRQEVLRQLGGALLTGMADHGFGPREPMDMPPPAVAVPEVEKSVAPFPSFDPAHTARLPDLSTTWYVLGWQSHTPVEVSVDGQVASSTGETLYIWTVTKEQ